VILLSCRMLVKRFAAEAGRIALFAGPRLK
jgi:hypothetical protein